MIPERDNFGSYTPKSLFLIFSRCWICAWKLRKVLQCSRGCSVQYCTLEFRHTICIRPLFRQTNESVIHFWQGNIVYPEQVRGSFRYENLNCLLLYDYIILYKPCNLSVKQRNSLAIIIADKFFQWRNLKCSVCLLNFSRTFLPHNVKTHYLYFRS